MNILIAKVGNIRVNELRVLTEALNKKHRLTLVSMGTESAYRGLAFSYKDVPVRVAQLQYKDITKSTTWINRDTNITANEGEKKREAFDGITAYEFFSNPADAMCVMLSEIMAHKLPDLVICGISNGEHMGQDIYSSSNIGMAMEACFFGIPTIAVGVDDKVGGSTEEELKAVVQFVEKNVETFAKIKLPPFTFLNINVPTVARYKDIKGIKVSRMSRMTQLNVYVERVDANGQKYYWADNVERKIIDPDTEYARTWFEKGYITIIPICYDSTDYEAVRAWNSGLIKDIRKQEHEVEDEE